jgi:drug/metabolite transporter (DMT)-like permease
MSEPLELIAPIAESAPRTSERAATIALLIACVAWGGSFTWASSIILHVNRILGAEDTATLGVLLLQSWRFSLAGLLWLAFFPGARRGWNISSLGRAALLSLPFTAAMIVQQMGLARTSPAVNAFLTGLNVLFVPLIVMCVKWSLPHPSLWIGIGMAMLGTWLLAAGEADASLSGIVLGVACALLFSVHILLINILLARDSAARMVGGQFLLTGLSSFLITLIVEPTSRSRHAMLALPLAPGVWVDLAMLVAFATLVAFGLMIFYQPRVDPTRAVFIYLTEPIFAAGYAWLATGKGLGPAAIAGAALIIAANSLVEWLSVKRRALQTSLSETLEARI